MIDQEMPFEMEMPAAEPMSKNTILSVIQAEITDADTGDQGTLQQNRRKGLDYYLGNKPSAAHEGRSQVVSTDVADAVEWILPQVMESLTSHGAPVCFDALSPEDTEQAKLETDFTHHVFMSDNEGFLNLYTAVKDALIQRNGILKVWYDTTPYEYGEQYDGLTQQQLEVLQMDASIDLVSVSMVKEAVMSPEGMMVEPALFSAEVIRTIQHGKINVMSVPPEEFIINNNHNSTDVRDARFVAHRILKPKSELIEEGYDYDQIMNARTAQIDYEREVRFNLQDETTLQHFNTEDKSQDLVEVVECYMRIDVNQDGVSELMKICALGYEDVYDIIDMEMLEEIPFVGFSTINMPHKFWGLSMYDRLKEIQDSKTSLWRNLLDNVYLINNREKEVVEGQVNLDDLLISRPGGIKRVKQPGMIRELAVQPIGQDGYNMLGYMDQVRSGRSGVSPEGNAQDYLVSNETAHGIERQMTAREKMTALMIRVVAETCLKPTYRLIRDLLVRYQNNNVAFQFKGQWIDVNPSNWGQRSKMSVKVGTGTGDDLRKQQALTQLQQLQAAIYQQDGQAMVGAAEIYKALDDWCDAVGLNGALGYFIDPNSAEGQEKTEEASQQQEQQMQMQMAQQAEMLKAQQQLAQAENIKAQADMQANQVKMQSDIMKANYEREIETLKQRIDQLQNNQDLAFKYEELNSNQALKLTEMELQAQKDASTQYLANKNLNMGMGDETQVQEETDTQAG